MIIQANILNTAHARRLHHMVLFERKGNPPTDDELAGLFKTLYALDGFSVSESSPFPYGRFDSVMIDYEGKPHSEMFPIFCSYDPDTKRFSAEFEMYNALDWKPIMGAEEWQYVRVNGQFVC